MTPNADSGGAHPRRCLICDEPLDDPEVRKRHGLSDNPSRPGLPPGCEPAAPVEPPHPPATAPGAPDLWYDDETVWLDQLSPPWWGHLWRAWQTIEQWIIDNRPTLREWQ